MKCMKIYDKNSIENRIFSDFGNSCVATTRAFGKTSFFYIISISGRTFPVPPPPPGGATVFAELLASGLPSPKSLFSLYLAQFYYKHPINLGKFSRICQT